MNKFICSICGYIYDEAAQGPWDALPEDWKCPICKASKAQFRKESGAEDAPRAVEAAAHELHPLTDREKSIVCSNLARGCEKQGKAEAAAMFGELASYFREKSGEGPEGDLTELSDAVTADLETLIPAAMQTAQEAGDRGAQRALTWGERVTLMTQSLLDRYKKEGTAMLRGMQIYVCTVCGFISIGRAAPERCPVCKAPADRFCTVEGGTRNG